MKAGAILGGLLVALMMTACGNGTSSGNGTPSDESPSEVTGPVIKVNARSLGDVTSFELKEDDETFEVFVDPAVDYSFNLGHINEHLASGAPVRVGIDAREGKLFATAIADADGGH